jgi:dTDP-4-dehydrorhamnose reductase
VKLLVTGAHGLLGRSLLDTDWGGDVERIGCGRRPEPVGPGPCRVVDLTTAAAVSELVAAERPDWVIHTAANTNVDQCETEPAVARQINVDAVTHVVAACNDIGAGVVQLSTDYVFDGHDGPYSEEAETHPLSQYGQMKLDSEAAVIDGAHRGLVVRTLWLYGHRPGVRPNLVTWPLAALLRGETVRVVTDQWGNPTLVADLARAIVQLCRSDVSGRFHFGGSSFLSRYELVQRMASYFRLDTRSVDAVPTQRAEQAAARPLRSGLRTDAVEGELRWTPATLEEGLAQLATEDAFRHDFADLFDKAGATRT